MKPMRILHFGFRIFSFTLSLLDLRLALSDLRSTFCGLCLLALSANLRAQTAAADSVPSPFQRGGIYDRPYILNLGGKTALGGYADFNSNYLRAEGVAEGFSFEQRRFNVFFYSGISEHVKLNAELEFEHGAIEVNGAGLAALQKDIAAQPSCPIAGGTGLDISQIADAN